jgi:hypothetical protein
MTQTTTTRGTTMATSTKKISVGDRVHYAPENLEAESAGLTPTWVVVDTNADFTMLVQLNAPGLAEVSAARTSDIVPAEDDDETNNLPA